MFYERGVSARALRGRTYTAGPAIGAKTFSASEIAPGDRYGISMPVSWQELHRETHWA
jgi:hypothetical protein